MFPLVELTRELKEWHVVLIMKSEPPGRSTAEKPHPPYRRNCLATECNGFGEDREPSTRIAQIP